MKNILLLNLLIAIPITTFAQSGLINSYQFNYLAINPAFAGENGNFGIKGILGNQFNGTLKPNQVSQVVVIDGQLYNKSGLAFQGFRDNSGNLVSTGFGFSFSKGYELGDFKLKAGLQASLKVQPNLLTVQGNQNLSPYAGLGTILFYKNVFIGISKPMILASKNITEPKPLFFQLGFIYDSERLISFNINTLIARDFTLNQQNIDLNVVGWLNKRIGLGTSVRNNSLNTFLPKDKNSFLPFAQYKVNSTILVGISYDSNVPTFGSQISSTLSVPGIFQLFVRFGGKSAGEESWFYNKL